MPRRCRRARNRIWIASLTGQLDARKADLAAAGEKITAFEAQVAQLLGERDAARADASAKADELRLDKATLESCAAS